MMPGIIHAGILRASFLAFKETGKYISIYSRRRDSHFPSLLDPLRMVSKIASRYLFRIETYRRTCPRFGIGDYGGSWPNFSHIIFLRVRTINAAHSHRYILREIARPR